MSGLLLAECVTLRTFAAAAPAPGSPEARQENGDRWWPFSRLAGAAVARSSAFFALIALGLAASLPGFEPESWPGEVTPRTRVTL